MKAAAIPMAKTQRWVAIRVEVFIGCLIHYVSGDAFVSANLEYLDIW